MPTAAGRAKAAVVGVEVVVVVERANGVQQRLVALFLTPFPPVTL